MTRADHPLHEFASREALATALADTVEAAIANALSERGTATIAVSGGSTPALFFRTLAARDIDWLRVTVTLVDERFVPQESPRSNAGLVAANLLTGNAATARFVGLYSDAPDAETASRRADAALGQLPLPFDVVVLGMGADGHTASFFPDAPTLPALLDPAGKALVLPVHAPSSGEPRLTLAMPPIASARLIALHIEGAEKRSVIDAVRAGRDLPIGAVLDVAKTPVRVFWAP